MSITNRVPLKSIASFSKGEQINGDLLLKDGAFPYLNGGINPSGMWGEYNVAADTVTISEGGNSCGYVNYMNTPFWCGAHCYYLFDVKCDGKFLYHALKSSQNKLMSLRSGACMPNIKKKDLGEFELPAPPPLEIQREIAYNLDKVSETIELCRKILEKLDYLVKAKFTEMFGDVITNNMNWSSAALDDLCIIVRGGSPRPIEHFLGGSVPWIKIGDATEDDSIFLRSTKEHIIEEGVKKSRLIKSGSLIFANCGVSLGFARIITFDGCIHDGWLAFENISESLNKVFLLYSLNQITDYFRQIAPAGTQPNLNTAIMKSHTQIVPPLPLQEQFAEYVKKIDLAKSAVKKILETAQALKNALMQKYFG